MHAIRVIVVTNPQTQPHTDRTDYNTLRRSFASAQCNELDQFIRTIIVFVYC